MYHPDTSAQSKTASVWRARGRRRVGWRVWATACPVALACWFSLGAHADGMPPGNPQVAEPAAGNLRVVGNYLYELDGHVVTALPDGKVLAYGIGSIEFGRETGIAERATMLRNRYRRSNNGALNWYPLVWEPQQHGWKTIEPAPECREAKPFLHTATVLPDMRILIAGGLCDEVRLANDPAPRVEFRKLSIWNGATEKWEPAPLLEHGRIYHTASLLPDGSVLIAGGESDPAVFLSGEPVLASVEAYANGAVTQMPDLNEARARHSATVNARGEVLVAGGFDARGGALASVERWDPAARAWRMAQPMHTARYGHSATLLDDGRILVAGGTGADGMPLQSVEIWDPASGAWTPGASLPEALSGQGAVLVDSGILLAGGQSAGKVEMGAWAWLWDKSSGEWRPAGRGGAGANADMEYQPAFSKNRDGSVHIFARRTILRWRSGAVPRASAAPLWYGHTPVMAVLADGRIMTIGNMLLEPGRQRYLAHIWNPKNDTWSAAGQLAYTSGMTTKALQLPSGRVMHVGVTAENHLVCELWQPADDSWTPCGDVRLFQHVPSIALALLDDGRAAAITNRDEANIFDERTGHWSPGRQEWNVEGLTWGAPIFPAHPLDTLTDEDKRQYDASPFAARFVGTPSAMLWDPGHKRWAYILKPGAMGSDAKFLPDGCAISPYAQASLYRRNSFSMFNPATGLPGGLFNPGTGISESALSMEVLKDGTVVVAGLPAAVDVTFFHRKASCAGWAPEPDDWALMPGEAAEPPAVSGQAAPAQAERARPAAVPLRVWLPEHRWLLLAVVGPLVLYVLLRFIVLPLARQGASRVLSKTAAQGLDRPVPRKAAWAMRAIVYGALFVYALKVLPGWLPWIVPKPGPDGKPSVVPCKYVGLWQSLGHDGIPRRIVLKDDGTYSTQPDGGVVYTGFWKTEGDKMVWRHNQGGSDQADVNPILPQSETRFELIEQNGWHTRFDLIEKASSTQCTQ